MIFRELGGTGLSVSAIGLGCARFGSVGSNITSKEGMRLLEMSYDLGVTLYDTANIYGQGDSERMLGRAFAQRRDQVVLLTKAGYGFGAWGSFASIAKPLARRVAGKFGSVRRAAVQVRAGAAHQDFDPAVIRRHLEESLARLRTDYVDIFLLHSLPEDELANDELFESLEAMKSAGMLRHHGFSMTRFPANLGSRLPDGVEVIGSAINPAETENIAKLPALAEYVGVLGYQAFGSGAFFSGNKEPHLSHRARVERIAEQKGLAPSQILVRYVLQQPRVAAVVVGISNPEHLDEIVRATELVGFEQPLEI